MTSFWIALIVTIAVEIALVTYVGWRLHRSGQLETLMWRHPWLISVMHWPSVLVAAAFQEWWLVVGFAAAGLVSLGVVMNASRHWPEPHPPGA